MKIAIIGGSGFESSRTLPCVRKQIVDTLYGKPSSPIVLWKIGGHNIFFLARHGVRHQYSPSEVPYRANIMALEKLGVTHILATTACGSLRENIHPGDFVVLDQFIDFTRRTSTFHPSFKEGVVHPPMSDPFDEDLRRTLFVVLQRLNLPAVYGGTIATIEGPRFSTRAESRMYQTFADVIGMTTATECALANEAGISYAAIAIVTDYDCWKEGTAVTIDEIFGVFEKNKGNVLDILVGAVDAIYAEGHDTSVAYRKHFGERYES